MKMLHLDSTDIAYLKQLMDEARHSPDAAMEPRRADRLFRLLSRADDVVFQLDDGLTKNTGYFGSNMRGRGAAR